MSILQKLYQFLFVVAVACTPIKGMADDLDDEPAIAAEDEEDLDQSEVLKTLVRRLNGRVEELEHELSTLRKKDGVKAEDKGGKVNPLPRETDPSMGDDPTATASLPTTAEDEMQVDAILSILSDKPEAKLEDEKNPAKNGLEVKREKATDLAEKSAPTKMEVGDAMAQYNQAQSFYKKNEFGKAEKAFAEFISNHSKNKMVKSAEFWRAQALLNQADPEMNKGAPKSVDKKKATEAVKAFADYYKTYPNDGNIPGVLIGMGKCFALQGDKKKACVPLKKLKAEFPKSTKSIANADILMKKYGCE